MPTIFSKIINGEIPGTFVYRDDVCVSFLSINPIAPGHLLVVPCAEVDEWTDLPRETILHLMDIAHTLGRALKKSHPCVRVGVVIAGYEIDHCHVHVIPTNSMADFDFRNAASLIQREDLEIDATRIRNILPSMGLVPFPSDVITQ